MCITSNELSVFQCQSVTQELQYMIYIVSKENYLLCTLHIHVAVASCGCCWKQHSFDISE
jgi:hypothetical protein